MTILGFHASHEQIGPRALLDDVKNAERAGFDAAMCSDHLAPWSQRQGESGFAWSWLGSALEATSFSLGVVNAPGQRYHPVIIAQAIATLAQMYPGRFWAALGSGEAMNEHVTGELWPRKSVRNARLLEAVSIIRALLAGEEVTTEGLIRTDRARVWSLPDHQPLLLGAAVTPATAGWVARWADGLATINQPIEQLGSVLDSYREAGGTGEVVIQVHVSLAPDLAQARNIAHDQWRTNVFAPPLCWDLEHPAHFDEASRHVRAEDIEDSVIVTDSADRIVELIETHTRLGADRIYLHHVGKSQDYFLTTMHDQVFGQLEGSS